MSYSTTLYAVDLDRLRAAVGSKDVAILERVNRACFKKDLPPSGKVVRIEVEGDGTIVVNGKQTGIDDLKRTVAELTGAGDNIRCHFDNVEAGRGVMPAIYQALQAIYASVGTMPEILMCGKDQVWEENVPAASADVRDEEAVRRLVFGNTHEAGDSSEGAYALQHLCKALGKQLDDDDALGALADLDLDSPLCNWRMPLGLPQPADFPFVSYLTPEQVTAEAARLESMDLSFAGDEGIEYGRKTLLRCLRKAAKQKRAVVAFYF